MQWLLCPFTLIMVVLPHARGEDYPIYPVDEDSSSISTELDTILVNQLVNMPLKTYTLGNLHMTYLQSEEIYRDIDTSIELPLPLNIGDIGSDHPKLLMALLNNSTINTNKTKLDIIQPDSIIQSVKRKPPSDDYDSKVNCSFNISDFYYNATSLPNSTVKNMKKIERIGNFSFGIHENSVYYLNLFNSSIEVIDIKDYEAAPKELPSISITDFWVVAQGQVPRLLLYTKTASSFEFYVYAVLRIKDDSFELSLSKKEVIPLNGHTSIRQATMYEDFIYYSLDGVGISQFNTNTKSNNVIIPQSLFTDANGNQHKVIDFVVNEGATDKNPVAFCIVETWGLYLYAINPKGSQKFLHPRLKKIDYFINPIYGTKFFGILVDQQNDYEEFFIEFLFSSPSSKVKANKIFTGKKMDITSIYTPDLHNSYLYDKTRKMMYIIRRGLANKINFLTYRLNLTAYKPNYISSLYNFANTKPLLLLPSTNTTYLFEKFRFPQYDFNCVFQGEGRFTLKLIQYTDACNNSIANIDAKSPINGCQKLMQYNIEVFGKRKGELNAEIEGWLIAVLVIVCFVSLITLSMITNCFKENICRLRNDRNKNNKAYCYEDCYVPNVERDPSRHFNDLDAIEPLRQSASTIGFRRKSEKDHQDENLSATKSSQRSLKRSERSSNYDLDTNSIIQIRKK